MSSLTMSFVRRWCWFATGTRLSVVALVCMVWFCGLPGIAAAYPHQGTLVRPLQGLSGERGEEDSKEKGSSEAPIFGLERRVRWVKPLRLAQALPHQPPLRGSARRGALGDPNKDTITGITSILNVTASFNLLGLRVIATLGYKWRLFASSSRALRDNFVSINAISRLTPAWIEFGALAAVQPASFITLRTAYRFRFQLPTFFSGGVFESADTAAQSFSKVTSFSEGEQVLRDTIDARAKDNGGSRVMPLSHIFSVDLTLRFKVKGFLALANIRYSHWWTSYNTQETNKVFYEGGHDMIFGLDENFFMVEGGLGYEFKMFRFLAMVSFRKAFSTNNDYLRVGPAVQWMIAPRWGAFRNPSLLVLANWYILHSWRGRDGVPLIAARFGGEF